MLELPQPTTSAARSSNIALTNDDDDCAIVAVSCPSAASTLRVGSGKRKYEDSEEAQQNPATASDDDANPANQCFFRISHTQLGRHKLFEKGAVATHDLGLQFIKSLGIEGSGDNISVILEMNVKDHAHSTRLATFMSEAGLSFEELRKHWRVWKLSDDNRIWNLDAIELEKYFPGQDVTEHRQTLSSIIGAGALDGNSAQKGNMYIAADDEQQSIDQLQSAGLVVGSSAGYRPLGEAKISSNSDSIYRFHRPISTVTSPMTD